MISSGIYPRSLNYSLSSSSSTFSGTATSNTLVTNLSVSITYTGNPIFLTLVHDGSSNDAKISTQYLAGSNVESLVLFDRGGTSLGRQEITGYDCTILTLPIGCFHHVDTTSLTVGTSYTYSFKYRVISGNTFYCYYAKLLAIDYPVPVI